MILAQTRLKIDQHSRHVGRGTFVTLAANPDLAKVIACMEDASTAGVMDVQLLSKAAAAAFAATNSSQAELAAREEQVPSASFGQCSCYFFFKAAPSKVVTMACIRPFLVM